jgi:hypothetical protein
MEPTAFDTCDVATLLDAARKAGLRYRLVPGRADELLVWGASTPEADAACDAMRQRRDEITALLRAIHPPLLLGVFSDEPDVRVGDLPWSVLAPMIDSRVLDMLAAERTTEEWERQIAGRDDPPTEPVARASRRPSRRSSTSSDRVVF